MSGNDQPLARIWCRCRVLSPPNSIMSAFGWARNTRRPSHDHRDDEHAEGKSQHVVGILEPGHAQRGHKAAPHSLPWVSAPRSCALGDYATPSDKPPRDAKPIHSLQDGTHGRASGAKPCQHQEVNCYRGIVSRQCLGGIGLAIVEAVVQRQGAEHGPMRN